MKKNDAVYVSLADQFPTEQMKELALSIANDDVKAMYALLKITTSTCSLLEEFLNGDLKDHLDDYESAEIRFLIWADNQYSIEYSSQYLVYLFATIKGKTSSQLMDDMFFFIILSIAESFRKCGYSEQQTKKLGRFAKNSIERVFSTWIFRMVLIFKTQIEITEGEQQQNNFELNIT
jgi:hypothetical protein